MTDYSAGPMDSEVAVALVNVQRQLESLTAAVGSVESLLHQQVLPAMSAMRAPVRKTMDQAERLEFAHDILHALNPELSDG